MGRTTLNTIISVAKFYLLAAFVQAILLFASEIPVVRVSFYHLGWLLSPWRSCPFPYDFTEYGSQTLFSEPFALLGSVMAVTLGLTLFVAGWHGLTFAGVVVAHIWFGWPRYWKDVRSRVDLSAPLALSVRRSWWAFPAGQFIWLVLDQVGWGYRYASYPIIDTGLPYLVANVVAIGLVLAMFSARALQACVVKTIGPDDLRCSSCGYLLRGLESRRCPECGYDCSGDDRPGSFGLRLHRSGSRRKPRGIVPVLLIIGLSLAPVWLPLGLIRLPRTWLRHIPSAIRPSWEVLNRNLNAYPVRLDAVCVVRHNDSIAVVRFERKAPYRARYEMSFWSDANDFAQRKPSDQQASGRLNTNPCGPSFAVGPWTFGCSVGNADMFWLVRPDATYSVEVFRADDLPNGLRWLLQQEH